MRPTFCSKLQSTPKVRKPDCDANERGSDFLTVGGDGEPKAFQRFCVDAYCFRNWVLNLLLRRAISGKETPNRPSKNVLPDGGYVPSDFGEGVRGRAVAGVNNPSLRSTPLSPLCNAKFQSSP